MISLRHARVRRGKDGLFRPKLKRYRTPSEQSQRPEGMVGRSRLEPSGGATEALSPVLWRIEFPAGHWLDANSHGLPVASGDQHLPIRKKSRGIRIPS